VSEAARRWDTFLGKVRARLGEIIAEAEAGLDELIETEVIDPGPVSAAENEVKARLFALREKISPAFKKLEGELDEGERDLEDQGRALESEILEAIETLERRTRAQVLKRLEVLSVEEEKQRKLTCTKCGAPLPEPEVRHRVVNVTCAHCEALNTVRPGLATAMFHSLRGTRRN
jgi:hypothetical protein